MKTESTASSLGSSLSLAGNATRQPKDLRAVEHELQNVFTAVLAQVDQQGYASAQPLETDASIQGSIGQSWEDWFGEIAHTRYRFKAGPESPSVRKGKTADDLQADYRTILIRAYNEGGYSSPETFLQNLTEDELAAVQQVQHLADPIRVEGLSHEAALNLILPPATQVDLDDDGITSVGAARTLRFPDSRTPAIVRDAWEATTTGMPMSERMIYELKLTRVHLIRDDSPSTQTDSTDVESFVAKADNWLDYLDYFKNQISLGRYVQEKNFWTTFRSNITSSLNPTAAWLE